MLLLAVWAAVAACGDDDSAGDTATDDADVVREDGGAETAPDVPEPDEASGEDDAAVDAPTDDGGTGDEGGTPVDPAAPGPFTWSVLDDEVVRGSRRTPVQALVPDAPDGTTMPLVLFLPGFQMQTVWYLPLLEHVASHGLVVVRADPPASLWDNNHPELALDAQAVLDWALDPAGPLAARVDPARVATMGHSNGGKIATMLAFADGRVTALLGLDPINGQGPRGFNEEQPDIVPERVEPLAIPLGLLGETTDAVPGIGGQACAPPELNFQTFYDAATSSPWVAAWELLGADHTDFVVDTAACALFCRLCREGDADDAAIRATIRTLSTAFLRRHLLDDAGQDAWLLGDRLPPEILLQHRP
jgi:pimeloyl-ACP methyl ester carboxylesterase